MNGKDINQSTAAEASILVYASYLLRYVSTPITADELRKKAASKHFKRLADHFAALPEDRVFNRHDDILNALRKQARKS